MGIVNVVATVELTSPLDLEKVKESIENTEFSSSGAGWLKMRLMPEGHYIAFYKSGKFLITGLKSVQKVDEVANRVISLVKNSGIDIDKKKIIIQNIVAVDKIEMSSTLEKLIHSLDPSKTNYEPEQFPGLIYKDFGATFLLFSNGKMIINGVKKENDLKNLVIKFESLIQ
ncbi:TATA-box-binding family protein [Methanococcoides methylutens]|uniref:TATA-box-binding family protein n=1 Tax=Methanococcoides methylutens TaxID=2226 RepID=UPI00064EA887|nr:TATA-box-binding family protein [Methanococcoides methylutens]